MVDHSVESGRDPDRLDSARSHLCAALDVDTLEAAEALARQLSGRVGAFKIGLELFIATGPGSVERIRMVGSAPLFLDLKLCDIPQTVERAVSRAGDLGVRWLTVHASGGPAMLERAQRAAERSGLSLLAVTVLTSLDEQDLQAVGVEANTSTQVDRLAALAWSAGVRGFVCSAAEVAVLRRRFPDAWLVTPGIRPAGQGLGDDQKRAATPAAALAAGADLLVIGRPLRDAADPAAAADAISLEIIGDP